MAPRRRQATAGVVQSGRALGLPLHPGGVSAAAAADGWANGPGSPLSACGSRRLWLSAHSLEGGFQEPTSSRLNRKEPQKSSAPNEWSDRPPSLLLPPRLLLVACCCSGWPGCCRTEAGALQHCSTPPPSNAPPLTNARPPPVRCRYCINTNRHMGPTDCMLLPSACPSKVKVPEGSDKQHSFGNSKLKTRGGGEDAGKGISSSNSVQGSSHRKE